MSFVQNNLSIGETEDHPVSSGKRGLADSSRQTLEGEIRRVGGRMISKPSDFFLFPSPGGLLNTFGGGGKEGRGN